MCPKTLKQHEVDLRAQLNKVFFYKWPQMLMITSKLFVRMNFGFINSAERTFNEDIYY